MTEVFRTMIVPASLALLCLALMGCASHNMRDTYAHGDLDRDGCIAYRCKVYCRDDATEADIITNNNAQTVTLAAAINGIDMSAILAAIADVSVDTWNVDMATVFDADSFGALLRNVATSGITGQQMAGNFP